MITLGVSDTQRCIKYYTIVYLFYFIRYALCIAVIHYKALELGQGIYKGANKIQCIYIYILLTKTTAVQNGVALSYHKVRGLYFLAVVFVRSLYIFFLKLTIVHMRGLTIVHMRGLTIVHMRGLTIVHMRGLTIVHMRGLTIVHMRGLTIVHMRGLTIVHMRGLTIAAKNFYVYYSLYLLIIIVGFRMIITM